VLSYTASRWCSLMVGQGGRVLVPVRVPSPHLGGHQGVLTNVKTKRTRKMLSDAGMHIMPTAHLPWGCALFSAENTACKVAI
jgi:hypothetical protein